MFCIFGSFDQAKVNTGWTILVGFLLEIEAISTV